MGQDHCTTSKDCGSELAVFFQLQRGMLQRERGGGVGICAKVEEDGTALIVAQAACLEVACVNDFADEDVHRADDCGDFVVRLHRLHKSQDSVGVDDIVVDRFDTLRLAGIFAVRIESSPICLHLNGRERLGVMDVHC
jgi:hypothetical protein